MSEEAERFTPAQLAAIKAAASKSAVLLTDAGPVYFLPPLHPPEKLWRPGNS